MAALPDVAWLAALAGLPRMGPARLLALTLLYEPAEAWRVVASGAVLGRPELVARMGPAAAAVAEEWKRAASEVDVDARWAAHVAAAITVAGRGDPAYPAPLAEDLEPPAVVFARGRPVANGVAPIDLLNGGATGAGGGQPRHEIEAQAGYSNNGLGFRLSANWQSATDVTGGAAGTFSTLHFGSLAKFDLRLFDDFTQNLDFLKKHHWAKGLPVRC